MKNIKIIFFGSSDFSMPILLRLFENFNVCAVVTESDKPSGRNKKIAPLPVKIIAEEKNIPVLQPDNLKNEDFFNKIKSFDADLMVTASYGKILPESIINLPKHGSLNAHPSLLPKYRGPSPIQSALLDGEKTTGSTIILMDNSMDGGDILNQTEMEISEDEDYVSLEKKLAEQCAELLVKVIPNYIDSKIEPQAQNNDKATYCRKISKKDGRIDWQKTAAAISGQIKAFAKWPVAYSFYKNQKIEILKAGLTELTITVKFKSGEIVKIDKKVCVICGAGFIELIKVKLEGKNETGINDFINGHQDFVGAILK
ncbi:MAG: methionyl-tRNA formyltransferase [Parcubacteria group bacterium]